ncbi:GntR family transcriptional regulator [Lichenihabitans psoromatis]|uniref:GntR family transcriptional regulator n=1 Tax=Lichenihabitans psoromatis TaxID=2528642 RepID=UPI0010383843|nr:GntR family transcriptional regulator [Lichenihabitans psoromatis]
MTVTRSVRAAPPKTSPARPSGRAAPIKPVASSLSVRETTYLDLKEMILSGQLRSAEHLSESRLAARLGVSRTPLREALMKLEQEGLVVGRRNVGYTVLDLDVAAVCDLLAVREALDICAAELACVNATETDLQHIRALVEQMRVLHATKKSTPSDAARDLDLGLLIHEVIVVATRNEALITVTGQIYQKLRLALWLEVLWVDWEDVGLSEHEAIADAILARDAVAAAAAARAHVQSSLRNMAKVRDIYNHRRQRRGDRAPAGSKEAS